MPSFIDEGLEKLKTFGELLSCPANVVEHGQIASNSLVWTAATPIAVSAPP